MDSFSLPPLMQPPFDSNNAAATQCKGLYTHIDLRENLYNLDHLGLNRKFISAVRRQAESVACLVNESCLSLIKNLYHLDSKVPTLSQFLEYQYGSTCEEKENFREEPVAGGGTAFLVKKGVILTAAHNICHMNTDQIDERKLATTRVLFGFKMINGTICQRRFPKQDVCKMTKVIAYEFKLEAKTGYFQDWALIKVDRKEGKDIPLELDHENHLADEMPVYMIGYPMGLPIKFTRNGYVKGHDNSTLFEANLDAFRGNSGSPVFNAKTRKVVGILCRGNKDYEKKVNAESGKTKIQVCHINSAHISRFEICQRIDSLAFVKIYLSASAPQNRPLDQYHLGCCYLKGKYVRQDLAKIYRLWKKAADQHNLSAYLALGILHLMGVEAEQNDFIALEYFQKAAKGGEPLAKKFLKKVIPVHDRLAFYHNTFYFGKDLEGTSQIVTYDLEFNLRLPFYHREALGAIQKDILSTLIANKRLSQREAKWYARSEYAKGLIYFNGSRYDQTQTRDYVKAIEYFQNAAQFELPEAYYYLGICYQNGHGIQKDEAKAFDYFEKAAEKGHQESALMILNAQSLLKYISKKLFKIILQNEQ